MFCPSDSDDKTVTNVSPSKMYPGIPLSGQLLFMEHIYLILGGIQVTFK